MATEMKIVNYTAEQAEMLKNEYLMGEDTSVLAEKLGKTERSVIAKLSNLGVYKSKAKTAGKREVLKTDMIRQLADEAGVDMTDLESLEKATAGALKVLVRAFVRGE